MNTYALSNCLPLSPEPFVSYKGQNRKVNTDITFLRRQISVHENRFFFMHRVFSLQTQSELVA